MVTVTLLASNLIADAGWYEHCDGDFRGNLQNNNAVKDPRLQRRLATASPKNFAYSSSANLIASAQSRPLSETAKLAWLFTKCLDDPHALAEVAVRRAALIAQMRGIILEHD